MCANLFSHRHIVNVSQEVRNSFEGQGHITYHRCAVLDEESQNIYAFFRQTKHFIDEARNTGVCVCVCESGESLVHR